MINKLGAIILQKKKEVAELKRLVENQPNHLIAEILNGKITRHSEKNFKLSLQTKALAIIAEIKRKSPSKGDLAPIRDPVALAKNYVGAGANTISVLTDELFFGGNINDLKNVAQELARTCTTPILRKDFIIDEIQIAEAIAAGADAVLLIVAVLGKETQQLFDSAKKMGIDVLVEVHNEAELNIALSSGAEIIGVNNRNLTTLEVDTMHALTLLDKIPNTVIRVAESGIADPLIAQAYHQAGFDAVLIGEALVKSNNPSDFIEACHHD